MFKGLKTETSICLEDNTNFFSIETTKKKKDLLLIYSAVFVVGFSIIFLVNYLWKIAAPGYLYSYTEIAVTVTVMLLLSKLRT